MHTAEQRWRARKPYATLVLEVISSAPHGSMAAAKIVFSAPCTTTCVPAKAFGPSSISGPARRTYVEDLVQQVLRILNKRRYGTYHIVNEGVCSYYEFALEAGRLVGLSRQQLDPLIEVIKEAEMQRS